MDSRDWLTAMEPRSVRPVVKRVLEEVSRVDSHAAQLYEEGSKKERSSDSSRRTHQRLNMHLNQSTFIPTSLKFKKFFCFFSL